MVENLPEHFVLNLLKQCNHKMLIGYHIGLEKRITKLLSGINQSGISMSGISKSGLNQNGISQNWISQSGIRKSGLNQDGMSQRKS